MSFDPVPLSRNTAAEMSSSESLPASLGFVGLGAMGNPMVVNLAKSLSSGSRIHVHDIVAAAVEELVVASFPHVVIKCASDAEVAEKSASIRP